MREPPASSPTCQPVRRQLTAADLFAGAGGLSVGLLRAGFKVISAVERDPQAADTYQANHPETKLIRADVTGVSADDLLTDRRRRLDLLAAGPPCQGFSIKGQRKGSHPANAMIDQCLRLARALQPRAILIENVQGLLSLQRGYYFDRLFTGLERIHTLGQRLYDVSHEVLNAAEYGLPQVRRRLFIVAVEKGADWAWPTPTTAPGDVTLWDAIGDLPADTAPADKMIEYRLSFEKASEYARSLRAEFHAVTNHHTKRLEELRLSRLEVLKEGQNRKHLPEDLRAGGHDTKYRRLRAESPAPTLTAHMGKDLSDFIHPKLARTLTVREAARLQGFPDAYEFLGSQASQFKQVGNAVPVLLAKALGESLRDLLAVGRSRRSAPQRSRDTLSLSVNGLASGDSVNRIAI